MPDDRSNQASGKETDHFALNFVSDDLEDLVSPSTLFFAPAAAYT